jgi:hypothetical protein
LKIGKFAQFILSFNLLNLSTVLALLFAFLHLVGLLFNSQQSIIVALSSFAAIAFVAVFHHYQHYYCRISSSYLLFYWLAEFILTCALIRSNINDGLIGTNLPYIIILILRASMSAAIFILENVPKPPSFYQSIDDDENVTPYVLSAFVQRQCNQEFL